MERIGRGQVPRVSVIEDLERRLADLHLSLRDDAREFRFYRLGVPPSEEDFHANFLQFTYKATVLAGVKLNKR